MLMVTAHYFSDPCVTFRVPAILLSLQGTYVVQVHYQYYYVLICNKLLRQEGYWLEGKLRNWETDLGDKFSSTA